MIINLSERPAFDQQRSKLDNARDDEHEHDLGSKSHERQSWLTSLLVVLVIDSWGCQHQASNRQKLDNARQDLPIRITVSQPL